MNLHDLISAGSICKTIRQILLVSLSMVCLVVPFFGIVSASSNRRDPGVDATLQIDINSGRKLSGTLSLNLQYPLKESMSSYMVLPFRAEEVRANSEDIHITYSFVSKGFTIVSLIFAPSAPKESKVFFYILPTVRESRDFNVSGLSRAANFLIIEDRGVAGNTLYFRFDTSKPEQSFGTLAKLSDSMIVPSEIRFKFPEETKFFTAPPVYQSSNINEGDHPGMLYAPDVLFVTTTSFYEGRYLWINYILPRDFPSTGSVIVLLVVTLCSTSALVFGVPDDLLSRVARLRLAASCLMATTLLIIVGFMFEGPAYLLTNYLSLIPAGIVYLLALGVLLVNIKSGIIDFFRRRVKRTS
jgi:hypothetical protein